MPQQQASKPSSRFCSKPPPSDCFPPVLQDNVIEDTMSVDPKHHRYFVARRGQVLRDLADEYGGVMVSFPRTGSQSEKVTLKGAKECVEAAKKRMQEIVEDLVRRCRQLFKSAYLVQNKLKSLCNLFFFLRFPFPGCSGEHGVCDSSKVPPVHHGPQGLENPADHQRAQCADQVPRARGSTR